MKLPDEHRQLKSTWTACPVCTASTTAVGQRLLLDVPPAWLPEQFIGNRQAYPRTQALSSFGALLNYDLYLNDTDDGGTYLAAWNEVRLFDSWGTLSNTGQYRRTLAGDSASAR